MKKSVTLTVIAFAIATAAVFGQFSWAPMQWGW